MTIKIKVGQNGQNHLGDAGFAVVERAKEVDAAISVKALIQQYPAGSLGLGMAGSSYNNH